ncbi:polyisoprenoid-binding protein [Sphingomonas paeninsulae]|uniref:Polyisoprenoid-binding protein n=1 Tax=Sphingomonas paeninsulae TaxID=2319844 RepID=A0A494TL55_SPHPE|nr:YceI family protein [Sphingomonas paeninsulae]AYJ87753.1 polyisoprenoid-binding protein [Sphingomonas paeninsulae]
MRTKMFVAAAFALAAPAIAQLPTLGTSDVTKVVAGNYDVESYHTQIAWTVNHLGVSLFSGMFSQASGKLIIDPKNLATTKVSISVPVASVQTTSDKLTGELKSADWFDATKYPTMTFVSTKVTSTSATTADITGNLTLHGVTKPVTIEAVFTGVSSSTNKKANIGFTGSADIKRSDFGIKAYVPLVSDEVHLSIAAAFQAAG